VREDLGGVPELVHDPCRLMSRVLG
jgi:hypothetical protein